MLGNFTYENPTRVHFGKEALDSLAEELRHYGPKVMLTYGGGSIKRNGIYDKVMKVLHDAGKTVIEEGGLVCQFYSGILNGYPRQPPPSVYPHRLAGGEEDAG